jgi:hypothetical protein
MANVARDQLRQEVLNYLRTHTAPIRVSNMAEDLRRRNPELSGLRDADFRHVVQPMIVTGKLSYAPGLKIRLADTK